MSLLDTKVFVFEDKDGKEHRLTNQTIKNKKEEWIFVRMDTLAHCLNLKNRCLLTKEEFKNFLDKKLTIKEAVFEEDLIFFKMERKEEGTQFSLEDFNENNIFCVFVLGNLNYEDYLIYFNLFQKKIENISKGNCSKSLDI